MSLFWFMIYEIARPLILWRLLLVQILDQF